MNFNKVVFRLHGLSHLTKNALQQLQQYKHKGSGGQVKTYPMWYAIQFKS